MLSKEYVEALVAAAFHLDEDDRVFCTQGYDESVAVIQNPRVMKSPSFILEDRAGGTLSVLDGGHDSHTQSIWIMNAQRKGEDPSATYQLSFDQLKRIVAVLAKRAHRRDPALRGLMLEEFPYYKRRAAGVYGYEVMFYFEEDVDLTEEGTVPEGSRSGEGSGSGSGEGSGSGAGSGDGISEDVTDDGSGSGQ